MTAPGGASGAEAPVVGAPLGRRYTVVLSIASIFEAEPGDTIVTFRQGDRWRGVRIAPKGTSGRPVRPLSAKALAQLPALETRGAIRCIRKVAAREVSS